MDSTEKLAETLNSIITKAAEISPELVHQIGERVWLGFYLALGLFVMSLILGTLWVLVAVRWDTHREDWKDGVKVVSGVLAAFLLVAGSISLTINVIEVIRFNAQPELYYFEYIAKAITS